MRQPYPIRPRNKYGAPEDVAEDHGWTHNNLQIYGTRLSEIHDAFLTDDPFTALGYQEEDITRSIATWYARPCETDDSYLISWESHMEPPRAFCRYLADTYGVHVMMEYSQRIKPRMPREYFNWHKPIPTYHLPKTLGE